MVKKAKSYSEENILTRWIGAGRRIVQMEREKARLEAFLDAFPGDYCGWTAEGSVVYSRGFCAAFGLENISDVRDIQNVLTPADSAALESLFYRLQKSNTPFSITAQRNDQDKILRISGSRGKGTDKASIFDVLWVEDITEQIAARDLFIEESEEKDEELKRLKIALDMVPRPLWMRDKDQKIIWCNETYADFLRMTPEEVIAEQKEIFGQLRGKKKTVPDEIRPGKDLARRAVKEGRPLEVRVHNTIKGGRMLMNITEIPSSDNGMTVGIAYNVTREEELESQLQRYEASNRELLEQLRSAIAIYGADERLEFYNAAFAQQWGLEEKFLNRQPTLGDVMEKLREERRLPEQADFRRFKKSWRDMFTGLIGPHEDMLHLPDGTTLRMLVVPHSMGGLMMTFEDVTGRLALESSYNTLIAVQRETLNNLDEAVAVYGGDGRLKLCNPAFSRLWGLNPEDLEGEPHISKVTDRKKQFFDAEDWRKKREIIMAMGLERVMHEGRMERADGVVIDYTTVPLPDGGVLITYADVTDTVRVENALREKYAALETAEKLKVDFLANVSYQLRTPLNAIKGFNDILDNEYFGPLNDRQKEYTRDISAASDRLLGLINDILDLSTLEAGYMNLEKEDVSVYKMIQAVARLVSGWAQKQNINMHVKCPKNIGSIRIDERRMQQAIINLIRNAIAFTPSGGDIELSARRTKEGVHITVNDTGIGISKEDIKRIFKPFERARIGGMDKEASRGGAGLGLSLVRNIIALHGGDVNIKSEEDQGTTVTMFLPFAATPQELRSSAESEGTVLKY